MVDVVALRPFQYRGVEVASGQSLQMEAIDAAVQAQAGTVSLLHGNTYQTRDMVAANTVGAMTFSTPAITESVKEDPPKRRRGRPRKSRD